MMGLPGSSVNSPAVGTQTGQFFGKQPAPALPPVPTTFQKFLKIEEVRDDAIDEDPATNNACERRDIPIGSSDLPACAAKKTTRMKLDDLRLQIVATRCSAQGSGS